MEGLGTRQGERAKNLATEFEFPFLYRRDLFSCAGLQTDPVPAKQSRVMPALLLKRLPEIGARCWKRDLHFQQLTTQRACIDDLRFRRILPGVHEQ